MRSHSNRRGGRIQKVYRIAGIVHRSKHCVWSWQTVYRDSSIKRAPACIHPFAFLSHIGGLTSRARRVLFNSRRRHGDEHHVSQRSICRVSSSVHWWRVVVPPLWSGLTRREPRRRPPVPKKIYCRLGWAPPTKTTTIRPKSIGHRRDWRDKLTWSSRRSFYPPCSLCSPRPSHWQTLWALCHRRRSLDDSELFGWLSTEEAEQR